MAIYFAPMEGITDDIYRRVHAECFSGIDKYFIPFISPTQNLTLTARELRAVLPENNAGCRAVPQLLTRDADHFLWAAQVLKDMGYKEVNLNLGCPSGTVTAKFKGSGMLRDLPMLRAFLDNVMERTPIPVSVKTRIGYENPEEWGTIYELLNGFPLHELIIHPRTREQQYHGEPHRECYAAAKACRNPVVYNGDLFTADDCRALAAEFPFTSAVMIGRGLLANPALCCEMTGGEAVNREALRHFCSRLLDEYQQRYQKNLVLGRMREVLKHIACCFENPQKPRKAIRKATTIEALTAASDALFALPLNENPGYDAYIYKGGN